jgi:hypothetical protein
MSTSKVVIKKIAGKLEPARPGWEYSANCRGKDVLEFVYGSEGPSRKIREKLVRICTECPVLETCRLEAIRNMEVGWWGGMDEKERLDWAIKNLSK